jgi:hypothetical protein
MSLPEEYVNAQQRIWNYFVEGKFSRKLWPRHMMHSGEMKRLFSEVSEYRNVYDNIYKESPTDENPEGILWKDYALELEKRLKL